jgi:uncharacterized protein YuzB (UPF0349 family)
MHCTFQQSEKKVVCQYVIEFLTAFPTSTLKDISEELSACFLRTVSISVVRKILSEMNWSWKVPTRFQVWKYSQENLEKYLMYIEWVQSLPDYSKIKYLDESHFVSRQLFSNKAWGSKNKRIYTSENTLNEPSSSVTLIVSLDFEKPVFYDIRVENNDQWAFLEVIEYACFSGYLSNGDTLICDNASVHDGADTTELIENILHHYGVNLVFLPAYSPELNPCELVFAQVKKTIRKSRRPSVNIIDLIITAFENVSIDSLLNYYRKCIFPITTLPELVVN